MNHCPPPDMPTLQLRGSSALQVERGEGLWVPLTSQTSIYKGTDAWDSLPGSF